ncbi:MAG TPA: DUF1003 domain-containing protein [Agriterribacter sp.]|nr:DUF1003 domain-containing protein [Agriterribacter sp.]
MNGVCFINKKEYPDDELLTGSQLRQPLFDFISKQHPDFSESSIISVAALQEQRRLYIETLLRQEIGDLNEAEKAVIESIMSNQVLSENIDAQQGEKVSFGESLADQVASFGGSWTFISIFFFLLFLWMSINFYLFHNKGFDPYPFILLNLVLSCLAAIQAPIIMMSQNRQEAKDRARGEHDYKINLKAELEIRLLHEKIDQLLLEQNRRLLEMQKTQNDMFNEIAKNWK